MKEAEYLATRGDNKDWVRKPKLPGETSEQYLRRTAVQVEGDGTTRVRFYPPGTKPSRGVTPPLETPQE